MRTATIRPHEIHPSLVHFPIALFPSSLAADFLGLVSGSGSLMELGRRLMPAAAIGAAVAGVAGLVAQEEVVAEGEAHDALVTHRSLNLGLIAIAAGMAWKRQGVERPGWGYLALGLAGSATLAYSAYLGGHMVYELGVGVRPAGGLHEAEAPEVGRHNVAPVAGKAARQAAHAVRHAAHHLAEGEIAPALDGERQEEEF